MGKTNIVIAGIGTEVGKTIVAAIVTEALEADYWKPVQSGSIEQTDSATVRSLISNTRTKFHPEAYLLKQPISPHAAAAIDGTEIDLENLTPPRTNRQVVIELAGGVMSPINYTQHNIHLMQRIGAPVIIVSRNYLGSINHTMLTIGACNAAGLSIAGLIFNGTRIASTEDFIEQYSGLPIIGRIEPEAEITPPIVRRYAQEMREQLLEVLASTDDRFPNVN